MLEAQWEEGKFVCVGLDSEYEKIPEYIRTTPAFNIDDSISFFNGEIVVATEDIACAYKPNIAFYEAHGVVGLAAMKDTISRIHDLAPKVPVILDAKRADIGNTNKGYIKMAFEYLKVDAITVHPYLGQEALQPFLNMPDKGIIVLCRTSNPGAGEFQDLMIEDLRLDGRGPLYQYVAAQVADKWNKNGNCAVVVGATYPEELQKVRDIIGDMPILIPGIGAQGGDVEKTVKAGKDSRGQGMIINSSRGIIFASNGPDFAEAARRETIKLNDLINRYR
ncbi:orotidine-5'-phosphate decarboxylase [Patescibacteria group bacterium]|nr:MAG: orotidine-5'-phosphate decarboxylase [Patescibacteria group bacterium]